MFNRFFSDEKGNISILGALLALPLLMMIGVAVDYTRIETAKSGMRSSVDHAAISPLVMMKDMPGAEQSLQDFINANSGRDSAQVKISIFQDKLRLEAVDMIDTPLLSVIGRAVSPIIVRLEMDVPQTNGSVRLTNANRNSTKIKSKTSGRENQQLAALKRFERSLERSIQRLSTQRSSYPQYTRQLIKKMRTQLREVRREIRNAKVR